jgi:hypothetical protein
MTAQEQQQPWQWAIAQGHSENTPGAWMRRLNEPEMGIVGNETPLLAYSEGDRQTQ